MFAYTKLMQAMAAAGVVSATDPYFNLTTLLLPGNGTNGAQNNTFLDSSSSPLTITRNGNTTQGTFSPFSQTGWGNYFSSSASLSVPSGASVSGTGNFTVEMWIYPISFGSSYQIMYANDASGGLSLGLNSTGTIFYGRSLVAIDGTSTGTVTFNSWNHIAFVRSGTGTNQMVAYINGVVAGTFTNSTSYTSGAVRIANDGGGGGAAQFNSYISNLRTGTTAVYSAAFTPSTTSLTAITGTTLLTCQNNRFIDNSANAYTITVAGSPGPSVQAFSPFAPTAAYSAATNGGSGYFDGSGDYLTGPSASGGDFSTGSFTISCWFYPTTLTGGVNHGLMSYADTGGWNGWQLQVRGSTKDILFEFLTGSSGASTITGGSIVLNAWNYVAIVRSGSTVSMYVNSTTAATSTTNSTAYGAASSRVIVGADRNLASAFVGYISNLKLVKQADAPASIPTAPDTNTTNTSFLLNYTNGGIIDATSKNDLETVGNAQISTTQSKWGGSSMYFDGTGDWLYGAASSPNYAFGTGDFTVEMWVYPTSNPANGPGTLIDARNSGTSEGWVIRIFADLSVGFYDGPANVYQQTAASAISLNTWTYLAFKRSGTTLTIYVNGTSAKTATVSSNLGTSWPLYIGNNYSAGYTYYGYIDDLRITKGYARTISASPTAAFALQ